MREKMSDGQTSDWHCGGKRIPYLRQEPLCGEISGLRFASLEMTGRKRSRLSATRCPLTMRKKMDLTSREKQVIEAPPPPALDNFHPSCYHLLKIRSLGLHTVELRFLSIRNISRSALFSVGRLFLQGSLLLCIFWRFV